MDFIIGLPKHNGNNIIMVVVNPMTMYTYFFSLSYPFKERTLVEALMKIVQKLHGIPNIIVSGKDPIFTRNF